HASALTALREHLAEHPLEFVAHALRAGAGEEGQDADVATLLHLDLDLLVVAGTRGDLIAQPLPDALLLLRLLPLVLVRRLLASVGMAVLLVHAGHRVRDAGGRLRGRRRRGRRDAEQTAHLPLQLAELLLRALHHPSARCAGLARAARL